MVSDSGPAGRVRRAGALQLSITVRFPLMSEMEVAMFRQRSQEAIRQKARRGEYYTRVPEGYVLLAEGRLEKDPDERVRTTMELLFEKFRELGSARQVHLWFHQEDIKVPRRVGKRSGVEFIPATPWLIVRLLKDPTYAGAYAFGRTKQRVTLDNGRKRNERRYVSNPEEWQVLIQSHHEGYMSWSEYLKNLEIVDISRTIGINSERPYVDRRDAARGYWLVWFAVGIAVGRCKCATAVVVPKARQSKKKKGARSY